MLQLTFVDEVGGSLLETAQQPGPAGRQLVPGLLYIDDKGNQPAHYNASLSKKTGFTKNFLNVFHKAEIHSYRFLGTAQLNTFTSLRLPVCLSKTLS